MTKCKILAAILAAVIAFPRQRCFRAEAVRTAGTLLFRTPQEDIMIAL